MLKDYYEMILCTTVEMDEETLERISGVFGTIFRSVYWSNLFR